MMSSIAHDTAQHSIVAMIVRGTEIALPLYWIDSRFVSLSSGMKEERIIMMSTVPY